MKLIFNYLVALFLGTVGGNAQATPHHETGNYGSLGVLVMAHGGDSGWNHAVAAGVASLEKRWPTTIAFGMARREAMAKALNDLKATGVDRVVVVPLFVSAESFRHRIDFFLGLRKDSPRPLGAADTLLTPISHGLHVAIIDSGLVDDLGIGDLMTIRASVISSDPGQESVFIVAHGMGSDAANTRLLQSMERQVERVRGAIPFFSVTAFTLREDWGLPRQSAEQEIRQGVASATAAGRTAIVIPLRLFGFGPYRSVLEGLRYRAGDSLLPHPMVTEWITRQVERTAAEASWQHD